MSQRRQKIWDSLHQGTRSLKIEKREGNRGDYPYYTGDGGRKAREEDKKEEDLE